MPRKKTADRLPPPKPEVNQCRFTSPEGERCPLGRVTARDFCPHHQKVHMETMIETNAVGSEKTAEQMRTEAAALLVAENQALKQKLAALEARMTPVSATGAATATAAAGLGAVAAFADPETAGAKLAMERQGIETKSALGKQKKAERSADQPREVEGHDIVVARMKEAQEKALQEREKRRGERRRRGLPADEGRVPIEVHLQRPLDNDYSAVMDDMGNDCRESGYVYRHIRTYELNPNGSRQEVGSRRLHVFKRNYGAEVVQRPVYDSAGKDTGKTEDWTTPLGVLVKYRVEEYAQRVIDNSPYGAFDAALDRQIDDLDNMVQRENSASGRRGGVGQIIVPEGHGDRGVNLGEYDQ
jgi:hypothetical protein